MRLDARGHRAARSERCRQVDADPHDGRASSRRRPARVTLDGRPLFRDPEIYREVGLVPEREEMYDAVSGWSFVLANAKLHKLPDPEAAARRAIATVEMADAQDRDIRTYSKGMKQRIKMATAIVHDPAVLLLDEPFNGMDPRQRLHLMELLHGLGDEGRTILFSSHILEEVEQIAGRIEVMVAGRHAASGDFREIRRLMTQRPHQYTIRSSDDRALASAVIAEPSTSGVELVADAAGGSAVQVQATDFSAFVHALPRIASRARDPAARGPARRRVPRERLLLPGDADDRRPMNATVASLTSRSLLGRRRTLVLLLLPLALLGALHAGPDPRRPRRRHRRASSTARCAPDLLGAFGIAILMPLLSLIAGTGSIGPEIDEGSIVYLLAKPLNRHSIVVTKLAGRDRGRRRLRRAPDRRRRRRAHR